MISKIDFSLIVAVLVLVQLFILNIEVKQDEAVEKDNRYKKVPVFEDEAIIDTSEIKQELYLVVHRNNGETQVYSKTDVAWDLKLVQGSSLMYVWLGKFKNRISVDCCKTHKSH